MSLFYKLLVIVFLSGCSVTTLTHKNNQIILRVEDIIIKTQSQTLLSKLDNYGNITIKKELLKLNSNRVVVYENIRLDSSYEFNFTTTTTIKHVFESSKASQVYAHKGLYLYQLLLPNYRVLNIMVEEFDSQSMGIIYGLSTQDMRILFKKLKATPKRALVENTLLLQANKEAFISRWSTQKIHFIPLITPLRLMPIL